MIPIFTRPRDLPEKVKNHIIMLGLRYFLYFGFAVLCLTTACGDDDNSDSGSGLTCTRDYNQTELLTNLAENIIVPSYTDLSTQLNELEQTVATLIANPSATNLETTQIALHQIRLVFQHTAHFGLGPAVDVDFRANWNNFPVNLDAIQANLNNKSYDFDGDNAAQQYDKGLPALDYFLYGYENVLTELETNTALQNYLTAIVQDMRNRLDSVRQAWAGYTNTFVANQGTDAGSSLGLFINAWNENYEIARRQKVGDPAGVNALGIVFPKGVEAYYSGRSLDYLKASLEASKAIFEGRTYTNNTNVEGLDDLLDYVDAQKDGTPLRQLILEQFDITAQKFDAINGSLADAIEDDNDTVRDAYFEYSKQVLYTKTDMPSILCIAITYVDNPSDSD